jgi:misacylated tRNA(Ala) deacylase
MTELLYQRDSYLKEFEAQVLAVGPGEVLLDRTAFYPGGGGQPPDEGNLFWNGVCCRVSGFRRDGDQVWHQVEGDMPPTGSAIRGQLDWDLRYKLMRTHTALHILSAVVFRDYGALVTGGNMRPLEARMDFELEQMSASFGLEVEEKVNKEIAAARPVKVHFLPRDEAMRIPDLIRTKVNLLPPSIKVVRVVEIEGLDLQADGGTHVANTIEIGTVRVVGHESKGRINKRLRIAIS